MKQKQWFNASLLFIFISALSYILYISLTKPSAAYISLIHTVIFFIIPVSIARYFGVKWSEMGISIKEWKKILFFIGILLLISAPVMWYASSLSAFNQYYPRFIARTGSEFLWNELLILPMFLFLEFFYRGFALFQFKKLVGDYPAIILQNIPYFLIHLGKPLPEFYYSFFAGLVLGWIALKAKSFLPTFGAHYLGAVIFDFLNW